MANVLFAIDGPIATATLNRPEKLNALNGPLYEELEAVYDRVPSSCGTCPSGSIRAPLACSA